MGDDGFTPVVHECSYKCKSERHASNLTAAITKDSYSDEKIASYWKWCCVRYSQAVDENGRTLLHMAAAKGRVGLLRFLLKHRDVNIHKKDRESHFSPLHCSIFYGHIQCAVELIKAGANIEQLDLDELTPLDHISVDRPVNVRELEFSAHDVYVWGNNQNSILGTGDDRPKEEPEPIEIFRKQKLYLKQVVLSKHHSAFLSRDGRLWMCGNGDGGRLGLEKEMMVTTPKSIHNECQAIALGVDHTIMVMGNKTVWTFGLNTYHQLGHDPPPDKVLMPKFVRCLRHVGIVGVSASKFHSAFWSENRLYTCGLNGGQLGHTRDSGKTVVVPKAVSGLRQCSIKTVVCTYGATILANNYGEIYLFYDYVCRKITSRPFYPKIVCAMGGHVDHTLDKTRLKENAGKELQVLVVTTCNTVYIWKESDRRYLKYELNFRSRTLHINDLVFHDDSLILTTREGKAYTGVIIGKRTTGSKLHSGSSKNRIVLRRIPHIHRAGLVASDPSGKSFAITQYQPKSRLYNFPRTTHAEVDEHLRNLYRVLDRADYFQDVVFEVQGRQFWAHRYIIAHASKILEDMMNASVQPDGTCKVRLENVGVQVFRALLCYIYTRDFSLISPYTGLPRSASNPESKKSAIDTENEGELIDMKAPFEYNSIKYEPVKEKPMTGKEKGLYMKLLERAANVYGVNSLREEFDGDDMLFRRSRVFPSSLVKFERERLPYLYDITLCSDDGMEIQAHKCILISRLEYFNCMMNNKSWLESTQDVAVHIPVPGKVLTVLINYLYTGAAPMILKTEDTELVFMTLILADQMFCNGLKNICEYTLSQLMTLQNVAEVLQIAMIYNANDLKRYSLEFICQNIGYLLESRGLDDLPDNVLDEVSTFYRSRVPQMCMRHITAFCNAPDEDLITLISETEPVSVVDFDDSTPPGSGLGSPRNRSKISRSLSFDSLAQRTCADPLQRAPGTNGDGESGDGAHVHRVANRSARQHNLGEWKLLTQDEVLNMSLDLAKEDKYVGVRVTPLRAVSMNSVMDVHCLSTSSERNFPALKPSSSERNIDSYPPSLRPNAVVSERVMMFSRGQDDDVNSQSGSKIKRPFDSDDEDEPATDNPCHSYYWRSDHDLMSSSSSEGSMSDSSVYLDCPVDDHPHGMKPGGPSRMKSKTRLHYQLEEKAMKELLIYYNADNVKDERITVRRAQYGYRLSPTWRGNSHLVTPRDPPLYYME